MWSLDHQWMTPNEAEAAITSLADSGWLHENGDLIEPAFPLDDSDIPLGWWPDPANLISPPPCGIGEEVPNITTVESESPQKTLREAEEHEEELSRQERRLLRFVAHRSGLSREEVLRRSERKRRALGPATIWICILLVAKEQGLEIEGVSPTG